MLEHTKVPQAVPLSSGLSVDVQEIISDGHIDVSQNCVLWTFAMKKRLCARSSAYSVTGRIVGRTLSGNWIGLYSTALVSEF